MATRGSFKGSQEVSSVFSRIRSTCFRGFLQRVPGGLAACFGGFLHRVLKSLPILFSGVPATCFNEFPQSCFKMMVANASRIPTTKFCRDLEGVSGMESRNSFSGGSVGGFPGISRGSGLEKAQ